MLKDVDADYMAEFLDQKDIPIDRFREKITERQVRMVKLDLQRLGLGIITVQDFMEWHPDYKGDLNANKEI